MGLLQSADSVSEIDSAVDCVPYFAKSTIM